MPNQQCQSEWVMRCWRGYLSRTRPAETVSIWYSWCHCHPKTPLPLASFKSRKVLAFWYLLTQVVLEKRPLNGCSSSSDKMHWKEHKNITVMRSHCAKDVHGIKQTLSNNASSPTLHKHTHMADSLLLWYATWWRYCWWLIIDRLKAILHNTSDWAEMELGFKLVTND